MAIWIRIDYNTIEPQTFSPTEEGKKVSHQELKRTLINICKEEIPNLAWIGTPILSPLREEIKKEYYPAIGAIENLRLSPISGPNYNFEIDFRNFFYDRDYSKNIEEITKLMRWGYTYERLLFELQSKYPGFCLMIRILEYIELKTKPCYKMKVDEETKRIEQLKSLQEKEDASLTLDKQIEVAASNAEIYMFLKRVYQYMKWSCETAKRDKKDKQLTKNLQPVL